jgi:hypothetical protein
MSLINRLAQESIKQNKLIFHRTYRLNNIKWNEIFNNHKEFAKHYTEKSIEDFINAWI